MRELKNYEKITTHPSIHFKHIDRVEESYHPIINISIVKDAEEQFRLRVEPNDAFGKKNKFIVYWKSRNSTERGELLYKKEDAFSDYLFATQLVKFISLDFELTFCGVELFNDERANIFVSVFDDYHKLVANQAILKPQNS
jgi:hypothetical protein